MPKLGLETIAEVSIFFVVQTSHRITIGNSIPLDLWTDIILIELSVNDVASLSVFCLCCLSKKSIKSIIEDEILFS